MLFPTTFPFFGLETPFSGYEQARRYQKILWERIFEFFIFLGFFGHFVSKNLKNSDSSAKNGQKKISKIRSHRIFGALRPTQNQRMGFLDPKLEKQQGMTGYFETSKLGIFLYKTRKSARRTQLRRVISRQPSRFERQMSPFWKSDNQGYNIWRNGRKFFLEGGPPSPLNTQEGGFWV